MRYPRSSCLMLMAALTLSGCSYGDTVLDWATGTTAATNTSAPANAAAAPPANATTAAPPAAGSAASAPPGATLIAQKLQSLRGEATQFQSSVERLQADFAATRQSLATNANSYSGIVAAVNTRLQAGTTAGNPELVAQWGQAQALLDQMNGSITHLVGISNEAANDSSFGNFVLKEIRAAAELRGVADSDRNDIRQLEIQTNSSIGQVDQLHTAVTGEIAARNAYLAGERNNLTALALAIQNGRVPGPTVAGRASAAAVAVATPSAAAPRAAAPASTASTSERPLVVIRFDQADVDYEQPLYTAVNGALKRKPSATFTIQAVSPNASSAADVAANTKASRENATKVLRSLTAMGMPADRLSLSATMSPDVRSGEVRIFVR